LFGLRNRDNIFRIRISTLYLYDFLIWKFPQNLLGAKKNLKIFPKKKNGNFLKKKKWKFPRKIILNKKNGDRKRIIAKNFRQPKHPEV
tara:strand:+ start:1646 stop:1909 length:264 start_codon:yes stop_codon:yes gene_type:complete